MIQPFQCSRCGECCRIAGQIHLTQQDITRIAAFLGVPEWDFIQRYAGLARDRRDLVIQGDRTAPCQFLSGNDCTIYPVRPEQCSGYPVRWNNPGWEDICKAPAE